MFRNFVYPSGSSAMNALRKAFKMVDPEFEVLGWTPLLEKGIKKTRLLVYSPLLEEENANLALEIYRETSKNLEITVQFNENQDCMIPIDFKAIAEKLEEQSKCVD